MKKMLNTILITGFAVACGTSFAAETPIGKHQIMSGMEIGAVYLQPIKMEPEGMMGKVEATDIHLEADIHAVKDNPNAFAQGDWIPYLVVKYELVKVGSAFKLAGDKIGRAHV